MKNVTVYSTATCGFCKMLKSYLNDKNVKYEVKMADEDQSLAQELYEKSGQLGVPFTVITDSDGKEEYVLGFDRPKIDAALDL
jgi:glutaredoxin